MSAEEKKKEIVAKAAAVGYRQCSYNPADDAYVADLDGFRGEANNKAVNLYVNGRVKWFLTYCEENDIKGRIEEADVTILPEFPRLMMVTSRIYMNDELVADGIAGAIINPEDPNCAVVVQSCATKAKGRALANAGFNLNGIEDASDLVAPDTGVRLPTYMISGGQIVANPDNPVDATFVASQDSGSVHSPGRFGSSLFDMAEEIPASNAGKNTLPWEDDLSAPVPPPIQDQEPAAPNAPQPVQAPGWIQDAQAKRKAAQATTSSQKIPTTVAEAQAFVLTIGHEKVKGKTIGELAATDRNSLMFYSGRSGKFTNVDKYPALVAACNIMLDFIAQQ